MGFHPCRIPTKRYRNPNRQPCAFSDASFARHIPLGFALRIASYVALCFGDIFGAGMADSRLTEAKRGPYTRARFPPIFRGPRRLWGGDKVGFVNRAN